MVSSINGNFNTSAAQQMQEKIFKKLDVSADGKVDKNEIESFKKAHQANSSQGGAGVIDKTLGKLDSNSDDAITMQEFEAGLTKLSQQVQSNFTPTIESLSNIKGMFASAFKNYSQGSTDNHTQITGSSEPQLSSIYG